MLILLLGVFDVIGGLLLAATWLKLFVGAGFILYFAVFFLLKGIYSVLSNIFSGFFLDLMGFLDLLAGAALLFVHWGTAPHYFLYIGIPLILKGIYCMIVDHPE